MKISELIKGPAGYIAEKQIKDVFRQWKCTAIVLTNQDGEINLELFSNDIISANKALNEQLNEAKRLIAKYKDREYKSGSLLGGIDNPKKS